MKKKNKLHIKIGDKVKIIAGNHKGLIGNIKTIFPKQLTATIDMITPRIRYKKNPQGGEAQKLELDIHIHISNLMLWDEKQNISSRIGYKIVENTKQRYFKKSGNLV